MAKEDPTAEQAEGPVIFKALHDLYDNRYVLFLPRFADRMEVFRRDLAGWDIEFFEGLDSSDLSMQQFIADGTYDEDLARRLDRRNKPMTLDTVCCSLGHKGIYEDMLSKGYERVMIFEDDVFAFPEMEEYLPAMLEQIPEDADLIYWGWLGYSKAPRFASITKAIYHLQHAAGLLRYDHTMIGNLYPKPYNDHFKIAGKQFCTHAYSVNRKAAELLVDMQTPVAYNADNLLMNAVMKGRLNSYIAIPLLFGQTSIGVDFNPWP